MRFHGIPLNIAEPLIEIERRVVGGPAYAYETLAERWRRRVGEHMERARRAFDEGCPDTAYDRMRKAARCARSARFFEGREI